MTRGVLFANLRDMGRIKELNPVERLQAFVARFPTQKAAAEALGISNVYVSDLLNGRRDINDKMLAKLGLRRTVIEARKSA